MRGFTLIETIVYMSILSFIMTGTVLSMYSLFSGTESHTQLIASQDAGFFVMRKIESVLENQTTVHIPSFGYSPSLEITTHDNTAIEIRRTGTRIEVRRGGVNGSYVPLTSDQTSVTNLGFRYLPAPAEGIEASTTIDGIVFETRVYER